MQTQEVISSISYVQKTVDRHSKVHRHSIVAEQSSLYNSSSLNSAQRAHEIKEKNLVVNQKR